MSPILKSNLTDQDPLTCVHTQTHYAWTNDDRKALLRYACHRLSDPHAAEDVVQETLAAALSSGCQFEGRSRPVTWVFGILKHKIADYQRANYRERARRTDSIPPEYGDAQDWWDITRDPTSRNDDSPAVQCERAEFWNVLWAGVDGLPPKTAEVFRRSFLSSDSSQEICQALDISPTNYWVLIHRARKHLQNHFTEHWTSLHPLN